MPWGEIGNTDRCLALHREHKLARLVRGKRNHAVDGDLDYTRRGRRARYTRKYGKKSKDQQSNSPPMLIPIYRAKWPDLSPRDSVFFTMTHLQPAREFSRPKFVDDNIQADYPLLPLLTIIYVIFSINVTLPEYWINQLLINIH